MEKKAVVRAATKGNDTEKEKKESKKTRVDARQMERRAKKEKIGIEDAER